MSDTICWYDGKFIPKSKIQVPITDLSITRGFGAFDFLRTYGGKPFLLDDHIDRLFNSAKKLNLTVPYSKKLITDIVSEVLKRNSQKITEANIKIILTGGNTEDGITPNGGSHVAILITPVEIYPQKYFLNGVKIITQKYERPISDAKSINYLNAVLGAVLAKKENAQELLYVDINDYVLEPTRSNIFMFKKDTLVTPKDGILHGITRNVVLEVTKNHFKIEERKIKLKELLSSDEIFMSSSNKEIMPIIKVNNKTINKSKVGKNTKKVMQLFRAFTQNYAKSKL